MDSNQLIIILTDLYAAFTDFNSGSKKLITHKDPVKTKTIAYRIVVLSKEENEEVPRLRLTLQNKLNITLLEEAGRSWSRKEDAAIKYAKHYFNDDHEFVLIKAEIVGIDLIAYATQVLNNSISLQDDSLKDHIMNLAKCINDYKDEDEIISLEVSQIEIMHHGPYSDF